MSIKKGEVRDITELAYSTFGNIVEKIGNPRALKIGTKDIKSPPKDKMMRADKVNKK
jgi:hypothetical protein